METKGSKHHRQDHMEDYWQGTHIQPFVWGMRFMYPRKILHTVPARPCKSEQTSWGLQGLQAQEIFTFRQNLIPAICLNPGNNLISLSGMEESSYVDIMYL